MEKYWTKKKVLFIVMVVLIAAIIPFIINWAYKKGGYVTVWDGSDMLAFYGNILTAAAAILGVYYTLDYSKFKQMDFEKLKVKPFLQVEAECKVSDYKNIFESDKNEIYAYKNFEKNDPIITTINKVPNIIYDYKYNLGFIKEIIDNSLFFYLYIENIGCDSAIKIRIEFNGERIARKISLSKGEIKSLKILIVFDKNTVQNDLLKVNDTEIKISYENVFGNQIYEQIGYIDCIGFNKKTGDTFLILSKNPFENQTKINN